MPPLHSRHRLVAGVGLLSLVASLLPLEGLLPSVLPAGDMALEPPSLLMLGVLGTLLSCGWFLLGYALALLLRTAPRAAVSPPARPTALSQMTTEQLYRELERMNRETLLYEPGLTQRGPRHSDHERSETDFSSA